MSFFKDGLRLLMYLLIVKILEKYEIFMHQLTSNDIVCLSIFIWVVRSQGVAPKLMHFAESMTCIIRRRLVQISCTTTSNAITLHNVKKQLPQFLHIGPSGMWIGQKNGFMQKWIMRPEKIKSMLMSSLKVSFGMKKPECNMNRVVESCYSTFKIVVEKVGTHVLI
jgi:hypothetical protein